MDFEDEFPLENDVYYLNHAAVAPWPQRTVRAVREFAEENGRLGAREYPHWLLIEERLRERCAQFIGARSAEEIALLKNTSEGLSVIAHGLDWHAGDNVVIPAKEFPSNRIVWESLARYGVEVRQVDIRASSMPEETLLDRCDSRTRLLSVSSVQYDHGLRLDLKKLGRACEAREILFCIDAIQSLGALPLNVREFRADFVVADGHKWLLGPEGLALFYCRRELWGQLRLFQYGWHMVSEPGNFDRTEWAPAESARRFECGSPNMLGIHALNASLSLLDEIGIHAISESVLKNTRYLSEYFINNDSAFELLTPIDPARHAGIVSFRPRASSVQTLFERLQSNGVVCAVRGGGIRFSPHFYTPRDVLDQALALLD